MQLRPSLIVVGLVAVAIPARTYAGAAVLIPPLEADIGETVPVGNTITGVATDVLVGLHWGSLAWKPTSFEFGIGFISSSRDLLEPIVLGRTSAMSSASSPQTSLDLDGGYITLGHTIFDRHHIRTWVLGRAELLHGEFEGRAFSATGAALRIASELGPDGVTSGISIRLPFIFAGS